MESFKLGRGKNSAFMLAIGGIILLITRVTLLDILGLVLLIVAVVRGIYELKQIKKTNRKGKGLPIAAIVIGGVFIILVFISAYILLIK